MPTAVRRSRDETDGAFEGEAFAVHAVAVRDAVARNGGDDAVGIDAADAAVVGVGGVEVAPGIEAGVGELRLAFRAGPPSPEKPVVPVPASVSRTPSGRMRRMRLAGWSQKTRLPEGSQGRPVTTERETSRAGTRVRGLPTATVSTLSWAVRGMAAREVIPIKLPRKGLPCRKSLWLARGQPATAAAERHRRYLLRPAPAYRAHVQSHSTSRDKVLPRMPAHRYP